ncbi:MAG: ATPase [Sphingomonas sp.]|uniref:ATP12 family chaperone protein n=1 Tax=Sphingomonas sp. TaxID=28214 RepID=UPI0017E7D84A|nr:ATP12 family protein [Sphingomonas sp.]MBA3666364.1 ATPase [Sphingomonas sp.]
MKRFWKNAEVVEAGKGYAIMLDGRRVKTPARADLVVPTRALAEAIASEWNASGETVDPRAMPLTGLSNAAIDQVAPDPARFAAELAKYGESDLLCYRAQRPKSLVTMQEEEWDPLLDWAKRRFGAELATSQEIMHVAQPGPSVARLGDAVGTMAAFNLAGLSPLVTISGSLIVALAVYEKALAPEDAWWAVSLDERWQAEQWGADAEAVTALEARRRDFLAGARFLRLLDSPR